MAAYVVPVDVMTSWDPDAPEPALRHGLDGTAALALRPRRDDPDRSCVVLVWRGARHATLTGAPHPLADRGLADVRGVGMVRNSHLVETNRLVHHVVVAGTHTADVVAEVLVVQRRAGTPDEAAAAALADQGP
jgi:hypothetical protein